MALSWPRRALARQTSSSARAVFRPTIPFEPELGKRPALSSLTGAINWYPRLEKVSIYDGFSGIVAKSLADPRMYCFMTSGFTYVSGPEGLKDLILRDETFRVFHEITEYVQKPWE